MPKTCFVIGPIGDPGSTARAAADDFMEYIVSPCPALNEHGYEKPVRADHLNEPGRITSQVIKLLMEAELIIADLTGNNANVYYELSLRHAIGKPVIHMAEDGTRLSFDVRDNRTIFYTMHSRVAERARDDLAKQIRHVHQEKYKPTNPIIETAGIIKLEQSTDPEQQAIGQLMRMMEGIREQVTSIRQQLTAPTTGTSFITNSVPIALAGTHFITSSGSIPPMNFSPAGLQVAGTPLVLSSESVKSDKHDKDDS